MKRNGRGERVELGQFIAADPAVCHGKPTYKGTRIIVWQILEALADGESSEELVQAWGGRISREAVLETIRGAGRLARRAPKMVERKASLDTLKGVVC